MICLDIYLEDGISINNGFFFIFYNFLIVFMMNMLSFICVGEEVCFGNNFCLIINLIVLGWILVDGMLLEEGGCYIFIEVGIYMVSLEVENICGIVSISYIIMVFDLVIVNVIVIVGVVNFGFGSEYNVCLVNGMVIVMFDGVSFLENEFNYLWEVLGINSGFEWLIEFFNILFNELD